MASSQHNQQHKELNYWCKQLAGLPMVHSLPLDKPRPTVSTKPHEAVRTANVAIHHSQLDSSTAQQLIQLCQVVQVSLFSGLHGVFAVLLSRYSNETDIVIGSPAIQSKRQCSTDLFIETLALRSDLSAAPSFIELLRQNRQILLDACAHQQLSFQTLVEQLLPQRSLDHSPLFQLMLVWLNEGQPLGEVGSHDLILNFSETKQGLMLSWQYNTDLFNVTSIARMAGHFERLAKALVSAPQQSVFTVSMLNDIEQQQLLVEWNNSAVDYPQDSCIHQLFEQQVELSPDALALVFAGQQLSYSELNARANQLACLIRVSFEQQGEVLTPDRFIGLYFKRGIEAIIAMLAVLKAGGAYVPLSPNYPASRTCFMVEDSQIRLILTTKQLLVELAPRLDSMIRLPQCLATDDVVLTASLPQTNVSGLANSDNLAYVIYTSGSTGKPKGVMVEHRNVVSLVVNNDYMPLSADTRMWQGALLAFDVATLEIWGTLLHGGQLWIQHGRVTDLDKVTELINQGQINTAVMTTGLFDRMVSTCHEPLPSLHYLVVGGDKVSGYSVARYQRRNPQAILINGYGPTENTTLSCCYPIPHGFDHSGSVPIGRAIANRAAYVLDSRLKPVPEGVVGELYLAGSGLARGYLNQSDLTAAVFVPNPYSDKQTQSDNGVHSERLYKTGDLVRWLANTNGGSGTLEFLGRVDHQVKIQGFRIELGEIEHALMSCVGVNGAVVLVMGSGSDKRLIGYVASAQADNLKEFDEKRMVVVRQFIAGLRQQLGSVLATYMVPSAFVLLSKLPLTPNGKVDRKTLPNENECQF